MRRTIGTANPNPFNNRGGPAALIYVKYSGSGVVFKGGARSWQQAFLRAGNLEMGPRDHRLRGGKTFCMHLKTLDAKKLLANGLAIIPWQLRLSASEYAADKHLLSDLSFALSR